LAFQPAIVQSNFRFVPSFEGCQKPEDEKAHKKSIKDAKLERENENMAKLIQAYATYGPRIDLLKAADPEEFMESITQRTTLSEGVVKNVQSSEVETLVGMLKRGQPVHSGVAIFTPTIDAQGNLSVSVRVDKRIISRLNVPGAFKGEITNGENIGKTTDEIVGLWNTDHPEDMIVLPIGTEAQHQ
jgi:hypothetical protein